MASSDSPFSEIEKRILLAELLKASEISSHVLVKIYNDYQVNPDWSDVVLPPGRTLRQCQTTLQEIRQEVRQPLPQLHPLTLPELRYDPRSSYSHPRPMYAPESSYSSSSRPLQPRPHGLPPVFMNPTPQPYTTPEVTPKRRKRGRPTKAEAEAERRAAEARGDPYPPPRTHKKARTSTQSIEMAEPSPISAFTSQDPKLPISATSSSISSTVEATSVVPPRDAPRSFPSIESETAYRSPGDQDRPPGYTSSGRDIQALYGLEPQQPPQPAQNLPRGAPEASRRLPEPPRSQLQPQSEQETSGPPSSAAATTSIDPMEH